MKNYKRQIGAALALLFVVFFGQAAINNIPNEVMVAMSRGKFDSSMIEEFGPNTLGKAIVRKIMTREKPSLMAKDLGRGKNIFARIQKQPVVVSISSNDIKTFLHRGLLSPLENPLSRPQLNVVDYNEQITRASGVRFPHLLEVKGEENRELRLWNSLRPKHAYVLPNELLGKSIHNGKAYQAPREGLELWSTMENEGNIILVLKDHVKDFSTFTFGSILKDVPKGDISSRVFTFFDHAAGDPLKREVPWEARYIEVQIWGEVTLADVKEVWVSDSAEEKVFESVKQLKMPVYKFKRRSVDSEDRRGMIYQRAALEN